MSLKIKSNINQIKKNLEEIGNTTQIRFDELFTPEFLTEYTSFVSIGDMFEKSGFIVKTPEDFKAIPDDEWERFVTENTTFESWSDMQKKALQVVMSKRLSKGFK
ncbi:TPA: hypothetical protein K3939_004457 [Citrobacter freundii]|nr:hypothetical protein [Citrobacter freundii]HCK3370174.1 hypothetical protein [Citrobacter freundii]